MYVEADDVEVDYASLHPAQHVLALEVASEVLDDLGGDDLQLVVEYEGLQALEEGPVRYHVLAKPFVQPPEQHVSANAHIHYSSTSMHTLG